MTISESEILDAIREAASSSAGGPEDAMTVAELAESLALGAPATRRKVASLLRSGSMACVRVVRPSIDGRMMPVPAYRLIAPKIAPPIAPKKAVSKKAKR